MHHPHADVRVRVVPRWQLTLERLAKLNRAAPTLGIVASGVAFCASPQVPPACCHQVQLSSCKPDHCNSCSYQHLRCGNAAGCCIWRRLWGNGHKQAAAARRRRQRLPEPQRC